MKRYKVSTYKCDCGCGAELMIQHVPDKEDKWNILMIDIRDRREKGKKREWHGVSLEKKTILRVKKFMERV